MHYDLEAEMKVLGAILIEPDALLRATEELDVSDFYSEKHRMIFDAILDNYQLGEKIDIVTISARLREKGDLQKVGGAVYCSSLPASVITAANIRAHAKIVRDKAVQRRVVKYGQEIVESGQNGVVDVRQWIASLESGLVDIAQTVKDKKSPHVTDAIIEYHAYLEKIRNNQNALIPVDAMAHYSNEPAIPHFGRGHFWVVAGYTSAGKSTVLAQLIVDACRHGAKCCVFSCEDAQQDKLIKVIANVSDVSQKKLITGNIEGYEERIAMAESHIKQWGLLIYDDVYSVDEIALKAKKHKLQGGLDIVAIDFIQNLQGKGSLYERMSDAAVKLQKTFKELGVTGIVLSQVNNESMRENSELIGVKGAGEIAAAADIVMWLRRVKGDPRLLDCEIRKNRPFGETGLVPMKFSDFYTRIERRL